MIVKEIHFDDNGREKLISGITKLSKAVKSTLGPQGKTVLLESELHIGGITVTKDGVSVARGINLYDPVENLAVQLMRQAAERTATSAGDGTTTSVVLTEAIVKNFLSFITPENNQTVVLRNIHSITKQLCKNLDKASKKVTGRRLLDVATISANNDSVTGKLIADTYSKVNTVVVENSQSSLTYNRIIEGIRVERGFTSKYMITDHRKEESILEDVMVLITDIEITNLQPLEPVIKYVIQSNKSLLIIGNISDAVAATLNLNVMQKKIKLCSILPPSFGIKRTELLTDLSVALGGHFFSGTTGDNLSTITVETLGYANKVIVGKDSTIILPDDADKDLTVKHVAELELRKKELVDDKEREFIDTRIGNIHGGIGIIYVGADSDIQQKELRDRVDDSVCAVKSAIEEGILPGGGIALIECIDGIDDTSTDIDMMAAVDILEESCYEPFKQILRNCGKDFVNIGITIASQKKSGYGYDSKTDQYGNMVKMGVIDPAKVTKNALKNAVSVATTILSTDAIVTNIRDNGGDR
jgi:chaperonin GroEL